MVRLAELRAGFHGAYLKHSPLCVGAFTFLAAEISGRKTAAVLGRDSSVKVRPELRARLWIQFGHDLGPPTT